MLDADIITLFLKRLERAITEVQNKYGRRILAVFCATSRMHRKPKMILILVPGTRFHHKIPTIWKHIH